MLGSYPCAVKHLSCLPIKPKILPRNLLFSHRRHRKNKVKMQSKLRDVLVVVIAAVCCALPAYAGKIALLLEQPYGHFGAMNPTGHAAIYLSGVCADTPVHLRPCAPGEAGVVISRYHKIDGYDWIAIPLLAYLYATDDPAMIPATASRTEAEHMRDDYRREYLEALAPNKPDGAAPGGEWTELVGESYLRTIYGFELPTTPQQDDALIAALNDHRNHGHFNLLFNNCANFAEKILNFYYPHSVHRNFITDFGIMTPTQAARSLAKYAKRHSDLRFTTFVIPQVPGSIDRSSAVHGVLGALLETKKYSIPLAILHPEIVGGMAVAYMIDGRFHPAKQMESVFNPRKDAKPGVLLADGNTPASVNGGTASRSASDSIIGSDDSQ